MLVQFLKFLSEVETACLVIILSEEIKLVAHLAVVSTVELEDITERVHSLDIDFIKLLNKGKSGLEVTFE